MRGAWIETTRPWCGITRRSGRPSCEGRGLKLCTSMKSPTIRGMSPLMRGAWIETYVERRWGIDRSRRPSCEGRGLKLLSPLDARRVDFRRPSCEGRGLKQLRQGQVQGRISSPLMRGAWIETPWLNTHDVRVLSPLMRGAWIETSSSVVSFLSSSCRPSCEGRGLKPGACKSPGSVVGSPLMRGAWIETRSHLPVVL